MNTAETPKIPAITQIIKDGYMPGMLRTVIEALRWKATSLKSDGLISMSEEADILNMLMLEEAILKDCFGIDVNEIV
ncbi:hypothetical protein [uncultured Duncaniella sp.]|uniref:hypothetical protein n=1 Tax=uncultured Duncaniella sp. TaxID=2768039 RepID=UPI0025B6F7AA|nr:hypothetical protein [uncultured Duncaniella sp.]